MPTYVHGCVDCNNEWEDFLWINEPLPECPKCKSSNVKRLPTFSTIKVELGKDELRDKIKQDALDTKREYHNNENFRANCIGEEKYHKQVTASEKAVKTLGKDLPRILRNRMGR